jgi:hypothetical protein
MIARWKKRRLLRMTIVMMILRLMGQMRWMAGVGVGARSVLVSADSMVAYLTDMARSMEMGWRGGE